jgi:predicted permease
MSKLAKRLRALWLRRRLDRDLEDELAFHAAMSAEKSGDLTAARRRLGNLAALKESCRDLWAFTRLESWWQDLRYAVATLAANPMITGAAIIALALGIGANATVYTVISSALNFDMGVNHVERLVTILPAAATQRGGPVPPLPDFRELRELKSVSNLAAYRYAEVNLSDSRALPERYVCVQMTASAWALVTIKPLLGRSFSQADDEPGATPTVLLSHRFWEKRWGGDPSVIGQTIRVDEVPRAVIGVMSPGTQFPEDTDLWTPLALRDLLAPGGLRNTMLFGELAPGATPAAAKNEIEAFTRRLFPAAGNQPTADVRPFLELIGVYEARPLMYAVLCAVGFVLLIVCADIANLLLARAATRAREISIRIALGAGRARIIRQLLVESVLLSAAGGAAGWAVAAWGLHWFDGISAQGRRPSWIHFSMEPRTFIYLAAISIGAGILFGLAPALELARVDVSSAIKDGARGAEGGRRARRVSGWLVVFQMAACVVLLAGAGVMVRSSVKLYNAPLGFQPDHVLTMQVSLPERKYAKPEDLTGFYARLKERLQPLPGVESVSLASSLPFYGFRDIQGEVEGSGPQAFGGLFVDAGYFRATQIPLRRGRSFSAPDEAEDSSSVIVNESFASRFWPNGNPLGKHVRRAGGGASQPWLTVIGVVPDVPQDFHRPLQPGPIIYLPYAADPQRSVYVVARTAADPGTLAQPFRRAVQSMDENLPAENVITLEDHIAQRRLGVAAFGKLFSAFAVIALALAAIGLYGVIAHTISRRTQEIGVRMAMGGTRRDILALVFRQGMRKVAIGLACGLPVAFLATRVLKAALIGVSPGDPLTFAGVVIVLALTGALGCAIPAWRAVRVDPLAALRCE